MEHRDDWQSANDELCRCDACVKERAEFNDWCNAFDERWAERKTARAERVLTEPSGLVTPV